MNYIIMITAEHICKQKRCKSNNNSGPKNFERRRLHAGSIYIEHHKKIGISADNISHKPVEKVCNIYDIYYTYM